jgi:hypothetical protein
VSEDWNNQIRGELNNLPGFPAKTEWRHGEWLHECHVRPQVANAAALPTTGNFLGDIRSALAEQAWFIWDGAAWVPMGTAVVGPTYINATEVNNNYTVQSTDGFIAVDASAGPVTITMPAANALSGRKIHVKKIDATGNKVTVAPDGADNIDGHNGFVIGFQNNAYIFVSNGTDTWWIT